VHGHGYGRGFGLGLVRENLNRTKTCLYRRGSCQNPRTRLYDAGHASAGQKFSCMGAGTTEGLGWGRFFLDQAVRKPKLASESFIQVRIMGKPLDSFIQVQAV